MIDSQTICENLRVIQVRIAEAERKSGRSAGCVKLMSVTKRKSAVTIQTLVDHGIVLFGENYPDETLEKYPAILDAHPEIQLHMIGHLQSRKAPLVAQFFHAWDSLDRVETALKMNHILARMGKTMPVLLEVNVGGEASKFGWRITNEQLPDQFSSDLDAILRCENLKVQGVMSLPPFVEIAEENRKYFATIREIARKIERMIGLSMAEISMGTSSDYPVAVEEGATIVRIGTALTGARD